MPIILNNIQNKLSWSRKITTPAKYPNKASTLNRFRYQKKLIFSKPMAATPAADPIIKTLPPVRYSEQEIPKNNGPSDIGLGYTSLVMQQPGAHYR